MYAFFVIDEGLSHHEDEERCTSHRRISLPKEERPTTSSMGDMEIEPTRPKSRGEPCFPDGSPLYFYPEHNEWLENTFNLKKNSVLQTYHRVLGTQAANLVAEMRMTYSTSNVRKGDLMYSDTDRPEEYTLWLRAQQQQEPEVKTFAGGGFRIPFQDNDPDTQELARRGAVRKGLQNHGVRQPPKNSGLRRRGAVKENVVVPQKRQEGSSGWGEGGRVRKSARLSLSSSSPRR